MTTLCHMRIQFIGGRHERINTRQAICKAIKSHTHHCMGQIEDDFMLYRNKTGRQDRSREWQTKEIASTSK